MKCALCGHENPSTARVCGACTAVLRAAPDVAPGDPAPGQNRFLPARDTLRRRAEAQGDPELFPASVLQLYEGGDPLGAHRELRRRLGDDAVRRSARTAQLDDLRLWARATTAPSMFTLNGVGTSCYGRHQPGPDGTYVLVYYFVVLFLPIWANGAYLVADGKGTFRRSWYFLAEVPLPAGTQQRRYWGFLAIGAAFVLLLVSSMLG